MPLTVPVLEGGTVTAGTVRFDRKTMAALGVEKGDAVVLQGEDRATATVGPPHGGDRGVVAPEDRLAAAGLAAGDEALLSTPEATPATSVTLAPPRAFRFDGIDEAVRAPLEGRTVVRGDEVRPSLFGGSLEVRFVVAEVAPAEPAVVTAATEVRVRDDPVTVAERRGGTGRTLDDVGGLDHAVETLRDCVTAPLEEPGTYREVAGDPPGGVLLTGPRGSGKTLLADAIGNETDARYFRVPHAGAVDARYDDGFASLAVAVARSAPAVVLLDDIDEMAPVDGGGRTAEVAAFVDAVATDDVVVVGTATRAEGVDRSLRRGGRLDHEVDLGVLDRGDRLAVLETHVADLSLGPDVDLRRVAARTHGFVGADLERVVREAARRAVRRVRTGGADGDEQRAVTRADFEAALDSVAPSGMQGLSVERPEVTYRDIGGLDEAKREVVRAVEWPLMYPELLDRVSTDAPGGILLHGLPGTGKTMLARAVANATDANFIAVEGPELLDRYVGESERGVREVFERAARNAPSVLFFDEIDALAPERGGDSDAEVTERVVSQLLTELDGVEPREGVVVIGATNRPDVIDPALLRPGRLERVVQVPMPDREARVEVFRTHLDGVPTGDVDPAALADRTEGYSGSDIEAVVREAGLLAVEDHLRERDADRRRVDPEAVVVEPGHFERALGVVSPSVSEEMRQRYADIAETLGER